MRILIILLCFLFFTTSGFCDEGEEAAETEYLPLDSKLIVNLQGRKHYLRAEIQLMVAGSENADRIRIHIPGIRHALIMFFSSYTHVQLSALEERKGLQKKALEEIRATLDKYSQSDGLKDVLFTEFLVQ
ncbi:MAG: flagellar basal body-associated FliL family protein [Methylococcales bacterium]